MNGQSPSLALSPGAQGPALGNLFASVRIEPLPVRGSKAPQEREDLLLLCDLSSFFLPVSDIAQLRKKFEEDKQRIALMRAQRKFRPY